MTIHVSRYIGPAAGLEQLLIDMLPPRLRSAVVRAVRRGVPRQVILRRAKAAGAGGHLLVGIKVLAGRCERGEGD